MLSRLIASLLSLARRPFSEWVLLAEAAESLVWAKIQLGVTPFAHLAPELGIQQTETLRKVADSHRAQASKISWAVQTAARYLPLRLVCLPQAMAANSMLSRRKIDSTLYLGVKINDADGFTAHAWLRAGFKWVTGGEARRGQSVVASFAKFQHPSPSRISRSRLGVLHGVITVLAILTLLPTPPLHDLRWENSPLWIRRTIHTVGSHDAWFNLFGFIAAGVIFNFSLFGRRRAALRYRFPGIVLFAIIFSLFEFGQLLLPGRHFDPVDIAMGLIALILVSPFWIKTKDRSRN